MTAKPRTRQTTRNPRRSPELTAPVLRRLQLQQARAGAALEHEPAAVVPARLLTSSRACCPRAWPGWARASSTAWYWATRAHAASGPTWTSCRRSGGWLAEALILVVITAAHRGITLCQALLKAKLSNRVNVMILEKALTLELTHFEDSEFYDKLTRARREASSRPLSLVMRTSGLFQNAIAITSFAVLLAGFSPWAVVMLIFGGLPAFFAETKFSGDAFRLFRWRAPETRMQTYLETALAREDHAKEVKLFDLGKLVPRPVQGDLRRAVREGSQSHGPPRGLGLRVHAGEHRGAVQRLRLVRGRSGARPDHARRDDHVHHAVPPGPGRGDREPRRHRRHVRGQPLSIDALRISRAAGRGEQRHRGQRAGSDRRRAVRRRGVPLSGLRQGRDHRRQPADQARREPGAGRRKRLGQDHADQAADAPVQAHARPRAARRPRPAGMGHHRAAPAHRRHLPGLRALPAHGGRERRRG